MSTRIQPNLGALVVFIVVVCIAAVDLGRRTRNTFVPDAVGFVPKRASIVITTGPIAELWAGVDANFARVIQEEDREGMLSSAIIDLRDELENRGTPIAGLNDLQRYGIDVARGLVVATYVEDSEKFLAAVPMSDIPSFKQFLQADYEELDESECFASDQRAAPSVLWAELHVVFPEPGWALMGPECALLEGAIQNRESNLAYLRSDDVLFKVLRKRLAYPMMKGPRVVIALRQMQFELSPVVRGLVGVEFSLEGLRLDGIFDFGEVNARLIANLMRSPPTEGNWHAALAPESPAVFVARDNAISTYLEFLARFESFAEPLRTNFGGALHLAQQKESLSQILVGFTQYRDGFPQFLMGLWGVTLEQEALVLEIQTSLRRSRDVRVLRGVIDATAQCEGSDKPCVDHTLLALLTEEPEAFFNWYRISDGDVDSAETRIPESLFQSSSYVREIPGGTIRYLAPKITQNDIDFRIETEDLAETDLEMLLENRYRLSSLLTGGVLWLATDERDLIGVADRLQTPGTKNFDMQPPALTETAKFQLMLRVPGLIEEVMLSGSSDAEEFVQRVLFDLRFHPEATLSLSTQEHKGEVRLRFEARSANGAKEH